MTIIVINNNRYNAKKKNNLLSSCLSVGVDVPYFCWHPELGSIGSCRQCAVKVHFDKSDKIGQIVMSCMTPITDNMIVFTETSDVLNFRKSIIELLMINHPHDCPVCEEGGNCHLQDMTVMNKYYSRRYIYKKKTHKNQFIGPFISHNMNRCISCHRCVRYYKDYSGGEDFGVFGSKDNLYFGRLKDGFLKNEHSGNLIEVCPTGVFTDKTSSENYSRKWDMQYAPSICSHCSVGCNILAGERYGKLVKIENRYHGDINHYFICDRGRFGYGYANRMDNPKIVTTKNINFKNDLSRLQIDVKSAINKCRKFLKNSSRVIGIGSSRASIESNYALFNFVGEENFFVDSTEIENSCIQLIIKILKESGIYTPTLREIESYDCIFILGEDVTNTSPRIALSVRQAVNNCSFGFSSDDRKEIIPTWHSMAKLYAKNNIKNPLFITSTDATSLDKISKWSFISSIEEQINLISFIERKLNSNVFESEIFDVSLQSKIEVIVDAFLKSKKVLIISGSHAGDIRFIESAFNLSKSLIKRGIETGITLLTSNVNSIGLGMIGTKSIETGIKKILDEKKTTTLIILENDLYRFISKEKIDYVLSNFDSIVIDHQNTNTFKNGSVSFPCSNFFESTGTVMNHEVRAQRFFQVYDPQFYLKNNVVLDSWKWIHILESKIKKRSFSWISTEDVISSLIKSFPSLTKIKEASYNSNFRIKGQKIARSPHRYSGRTAQFSDKNIHEKSQPIDINSMFSFSMEGNNQLSETSSQIPFSWFPGWNSLQSWNKFQDEIAGNLKNGNPGIRILDNVKNCNIKNINSISNFQKTIFNENNFLVVPFYTLFNSEELSSRSELIRKNFNKENFARISIFDARKLDLFEGDIIQFYCLDTKFVLYVEISKFLKSGHIGLSVGNSNIPLFLLGRKITNLRKKDQT
ncbi:NADH-quinone oxidoreductase subunit G [Buchnera aphidicola (Tetraneura ulmi)]|uniref:NADH-quinone oxidoreductase subunit NuoG n=1 Tax=Buchnera aphidicola TaxID=9 RepID=UPI003463D17A